MDKQIYRFIKEEIKELTYNQLKIFSVIRQFNVDGKSSISIDEIVKRTKILKNHVFKEIKFLEQNNYLVKDNKNYIINKLISDGEQFLYWEDKDLELKLTYNQFVLYCLIRTNSSKFGYAMLKQKTISDITGIAVSHVSRIIKQLSDKGLIRLEKEKTYTKFFIIENIIEKNIEQEKPILEEKVIIEKKSRKENTKKQELEDYLKWLFQLHTITPAYRKKIKSLMEKFNCDEEVILQTLKYNEDTFKWMSNSQKYNTIDYLFNAVMKRLEGGEMKAFGENKYFNSLISEQIERNIQMQKERDCWEAEEKRLLKLSEEENKKDYEFYNRINKKQQNNYIVKVNECLNNPLFADLWEN